MVPVFAAIPVDTIVWVALLLIGVISSLVSNARKAVKASRTVAVRQARHETAPAAPSVIPSTQPVTSSTPRVILSPSKDPVVVRQAHHDTKGGTGAFRGMFERGSLVRAIVAAEILRPPKALQEQSIWSPRHSEPSI